MNCVTCKRIIVFKKEVKENGICLTCYDKNFGIVTPALEAVDKYPSKVDLHLTWVKGMRLKELQNEVAIQMHKAFHGNGTQASKALKCSIRTLRFIRANHRKKQKQKV